MTLSDIAAWYAAIVATAVLIWDYVKWKNSGPQISAFARSGMRSLNIPETANMTLIYVEVTNTGDKPTTLKSWGMYWYPVGVSLNDKRGRQAWILRSSFADMGVVPQKIEPGDVWRGVIEEDDEVQKMKDNGTFFVMLSFSHSQEEVLVRVEQNKVSWPTLNEPQNS